MYNFNVNSSCNQNIFGNNNNNSLFNNKISSMNLE